MEYVYHIVVIRVNETSWAHVWRLRSHYLRTGCDTDWERRMTRPAFKTSASHGFVCSSVRPCEVWLALQLGPIKVFKCLVRRAKALCRVTMTLRTDHTWKNPLLNKLSEVPI
jgi:hypothetical protein